MPTDPRFQNIADRDYGDRPHDRMADQFAVTIDNMVAQMLRNLITGKGKSFAHHDMTNTLAALEEYVTAQRNADA